MNRGSKDAAVPKTTAAGAVRTTLPTPYEIGQRQIATAQPVQPGGIDPSPQTAGIKVRDV